MRIKGKISSWHEDKGYGFVTPLTGGKQVFIHIKAFANRNRRPEINDVVTFALSKDKQGRPCAEKATFAGEKLTKKVTKKPGAPLIVFALAFLIAVGLTVVTGDLPGLVGIAYAALSVITFGAYYLDKTAATSGARRTPESTLHLLALAGGWPGALIAQQTLRHKSKKMEFRIVLWLTVLINGGAFVWWLTADGRAALQTVLG